MMKTYIYYVDICKKCGKIKGESDMHFCSGCGFGKMDDLKFAWREAELVEKV